MAFTTRRTVYYLALVVATTAILTVVYNLGMGVWEGRTQPLYRSLQVVIQSFTTTGYGEDAGWQTPQMNIFVILLQLTGIGLILTAVDVFAVPWLRDALSPVAPTTAPEQDGHVVVCGYTPRTEAFIDELDARGRDYVLVEPDEETARTLHESDYRLLHGDPESTDVLERAHVGAALAVVADVADDTNASIVLSAREVAPQTRVVTLVESADLGQYHRIAGADEVLSPRQLLGESLAAELPVAVTTTTDENVVVGEDFELAELAVEERSELADRTFADAGLRERFGVNVIGAWLDGRFETPVDPDTELRAGTRLLVAGDPDHLEALRDATESKVQQFSPQQVILAGHGDSGQAAYDALAPTHSELTLVDIENKEPVDVVGDARDPEVLERAGIGDATALLLMIGDDTAAILSTLIARDLNPDVRIVVRANEEENIQKLYRAGADYARSLATVSGRMMASTVLEDEEALAYDKQIRIVKLPVPGLVGGTLVEADVRAETGCTVVAIHRGEETITDFDPAAYQFEPGDEVTVAGTDDGITAFEGVFGS
ncbi:MAG: NAD-binding protein [Haloarculaceae archaeon]